MFPWESVTVGVTPRLLFVATTRRLPDVTLRVTEVDVPEDVPFEASLTKEAAAWTGVSEERKKDTTKRAVIKPPAIFLRLFIF